MAEQGWTGGWVVSLAQAPGTVTPLTSEWTQVSPRDLTSQVLRL